MKPFNLWRPINPRMTMHRTDLQNTAKALRFLGFLKSSQEQDADEPEDSIIDGLRQFQRRFGLKPDGVMYPNGPTHRRIKQVLDKSGAAVANLDSIVAGEHEESDRQFRLAHSSIPIPVPGGRPDLPFGSGPQRAPSPLSPNPSGRRGKAPHNDPDEGSRPHQRSRVAPVEAPPIVRLMRFLGLANAVSAMAIFNSRDKKRQDALRRRRLKEDDERWDYCERRKAEEIRRRCRGIDKKWVSRCIARAEIRRDMCYRRIPEWNQVEEWNEADMEESPERGM